MPLPPALLARLQKRGIVKPEPEPVVEEEVIAEFYDDQEKRVDVNDNNIGYTSDDDLRETEFAEVDLNEPVVGCPNKWNVYHECSAFCKEKWGDGKLHPSPNTERKRLKMLKKFPLLEGWDEIYDPGTGRHYYWNTMTDEVSWLPFGHPRCKLSLPAKKLRALVRDTFMQDIEDIEEHEASESEEEEEEEQDEIKDKEHMDDDGSRDRRYRKSNGREKSQGRTKVRENDLDPMDPASYSEAPRGTWSTGLDRKGEAKTGADTTASGPLYQMRPYPSPGAVLRMNAEMKNRDALPPDDSDA